MGLWRIQKGHRNPHVASNYRGLIAPNASDNLYHKVTILDVITINKAAVITGLEALTEEKKNKFAFKYISAQ